MSEVTVHVVPNEKYYTDNFLKVTDVDRVNPSMVSVWVQFPNDKYVEYHKGFFNGPDYSGSLVNFSSNFDDSIMQDKDWEFPDDYSSCDLVFDTDFVIDHVCVIAWKWSYQILLMQDIYHDNITDVDTTVITYDQKEK